MNLLDMRTVILSYAISNLISMVVIAFLWVHNRLKYAGLNYWLANFSLQFIALALLVLRGFLFSPLSTTLSNAMMVAGIILLFIGLEHFTGKRGPQLHNYILLAVYILLHVYFLYLKPSLTMRNLLFSLGMFLACSQCAWLMLYRVSPEIRRITSGVGHVFVALCLVNIVHFVVDLRVPVGNDFFQSNVYDTLIITTSQMLFIMLTFTLFLMVNRRLFADLESDIAARNQVEAALRLSEEKFYKAFQSSIDAITISRMRDGHYVEVNDGFSRLTGYSRAEALSDSSLQLGLWANPQDRAHVVAALQENKRIQDVECIFRTKTGDLLTCLVSGEIIQLGNEAHILAMVRDVTQSKQTEKALRISEETFRTAFHSSPVALVINREQDRQIVDVNGAFCRLTGYSREEVIGHDAPELVAISLEDRERYRQVRLGNEAVRELEMTLTKKSGETATVLLSSEIINLGNEKCVLATLNDLTARKQAESIVRLRLTLWEYAAMHPVNELMQKALDEIEELTGSTIGFYHFLSENQNTVVLVAWSTRTLAEFCRVDSAHIHYSVDLAGVWVDCVHQRKPVIHNDISALAHRKGFPAGHAIVVRELIVPTIRDGQVVAVLGVGNKPSDYGEQDVNLVSYIADLVWSIVDQKRANEEIHQLNSQLERLAMTDELTSLMNRRSFFIKGAKEVETARSNRTPCALLMLDVDRFKSVNDNYGHDAGDLVLQWVAQKLVENVRDVDLVARLGGEEFGVLLPNLCEEEAIKLAERLRQAVEKTSCPFRDLALRVTVSVGVALYNQASGDFDTILRHADRAMYQAKNQGRNRVVVLD